MQKSLFPCIHSSIAQSLRQIGADLRGLDQHEDSLVYQMQSLRMFKDLYGDKHKQVAESLIRVGAACQKVDKLQESL